MVVATAAQAGVSIRAFRLPRLQQPVADRAAGEDAGERAGSDHEQEGARERLVDPVLLLRELQAEGLQAGEEVVAAGTREDQDDVRAHAEDVPGRVHEAHPARLAWLDDELGIGRQAALPRDPLRIGLLPALAGARRLRGRRGPGLVREDAEPAALRALAAARP